jgi:hypothetical protein
MDEQSASHDHPKSAGRPTPPEEKNHPSESHNSCIDRGEPLVRGAKHTGNNASRDHHRRQYEQFENTWRAIPSFHGAQLLVLQPSLQDLSSQLQRLFSKLPKWEFFSNSNTQNHFTHFRTYTSAGTKCSTWNTCANCGCVPRGTHLNIRHPPAELSRGTCDR